jgi:hypothetical protein
MSAPRRRRWIDVFRRTTQQATRAPLEEAALWSAHEQAARAHDDASANAERVAAGMARQRSLIDGATERAELVAARAEGLNATAARVSEAFERLGVVALNAGLEGARSPETQGRALLLLSEEIRANVVRGADAAAQLTRVVEELAQEAGDLRQKLDRSRSEAAGIAQAAASTQTASQTASRALEDLGARLRKATGIDPDVARAVASATEHARGLMTALSALSAAAPSAPVASALGPVIGPLQRLLGEIEANEGDDEGSGP